MPIRFVADLGLSVGFESLPRNQPLNNLQQVVDRSMGLAKGARTVMIRPRPEFAAVVRRAERQHLHVVMRRLIVVVSFSFRSVIPSSFHKQAAWQ